jgi:hypothetical protein
VPIDAPAGRAYSGAVANTTHVVVFGGRTGDALDAVPGDLALEASSGVMRQGDATAAALRLSQAAVVDVPDNAYPVVSSSWRAFALFGVNEDGSEADPRWLWVLPASGGPWMRVRANGTNFPVARRGAQGAYLRECRAGRNCIIVYGGIGKATVNTAADACESAARRGAARRGGAMRLGGQARARAHPRLHRGRTPHTDRRCGACPPPLLHPSPPTSQAGSFSPPR